jgi:tetratricopeptide (TPR) repeat protein
MGRFFDTTLHRPVASDREQRIVALLERGTGRDQLDALVAQALAELDQDDAPSEPALARIAQALDRCEAGDAVRIRFWRQLARRFPDHAYILACRGDALLYAGREREAMDAFLAAFDIAPALAEVFDDAADLAHSLGGAWWLSYQLVELRAALAAAAEAASLAGSDDDCDDAGSDHDDDDDADDDDADDDDDDDDDDAEPELDVRERYSELLDEYRGDAAALAAIRALGHRIAELEDAGVLPRALVRRGDWRR